MSLWLSGLGRVPDLATTTAAAVSTNTSMESGIEAGPIPTITGSLGSGTRGSLGTISRVGMDNEPMYDTDHTDLGSDVDEAEIRRELLNDVSITKVPLNLPFM